MKKPFLILVAGGSASGKSTVVENILNQANKKDVLIISHDDYYKKLDLPLSERIKINYDHPNSLDNELLITHIDNLLKGKSIKKPLYDFLDYNRLEKFEEVYPKKIIIIEGILILENLEIRKKANLKIFVESDDDIRFIRRLKRDIRLRKRSVESIIDQYLKTVKPMHYKYIKPTKRYADIIIPNDNRHDVAVDVIAGKIRDVIEND